MRRLAPAAALLTAALWCAGAATAATDDTLQNEEKEPMIRVKAREAAKQGLPAIGLSVDTSGTAMSATRFPDPGYYLTLSGPPGGPLMMQVIGYEAASHDEATLDAAIRRHFDKPWYQPFSLDGTAFVHLAGADRRARSFFTGSSPMDRTRWCAALVPQRPAAGPGLLVVFGDAAGASKVADCAAIIAHPDLAPLVRSFSMD